jgi:hypothetical protein
MDKKYHETIPNIVKELPLAALSDDENGAMIEVTKKPRKSRKFTVGKNGLYPDEDVKITRWWVSRMAATDVQSTAVRREEDIKTRVSMQRAREIQLQIILILETLALEISMSDTKLEVISSQPLGEERLSPTQNQKSKKPKDLNVLLDLLVDKLCIWHTMNADESESSPKRTNVLSQNGTKGTDESARLNKLRAFYIDVVLPL